MAEDALVWKVGDAVVTRIEESIAYVPAAGLLPSSEPEVVARHHDWLRPQFVDDDGNLVLSIHGLVVEVDGLRILVDTCIGDRGMPGVEPASGWKSPFMDNLATAGFSPESIDVVLCTHLHFDHVGWNTKLAGGRWVPTFPNARYLIGRVEWEHWAAEGGGGYVATLDDAVRPLVEGGAADLVETDHRISESVRLEATPGHTPGHVAVRISSSGQEALITGDLTHHPVQWAQPDWYALPDTDPTQSSATRRRLIEEHADTATVLIGTHYPPPCAGHLVSAGEGARFRPLA